MLNTIKEDLPQYDFLSETTSNGLHWTERELENPKNKIRKPSLSPARTRFKEITHWAKIGFC
jgi:hypothetical protein